jgi:N6-L-threonylcarbamoyladenine synthase
VNFAKAAALALDVPLIPVHHVRGHIAANYIAYPALEPPFLCLAVSGGNTLLVDVQTYTEMRVLGSTRDDAAGECFDKTARILGLGYPGGKPVDLLSRGGDDKKYPLPVGNVEDHPYDMSFSGLKTAVTTRTKRPAARRGLDKPSLCATICAAMSSRLLRARCAPRASWAAKDRRGGGRGRELTHPRGF